jgi:hypothetical protein
VNARKIYIQQKRVTLSLPHLCAPTCCAQVCILNHELLKVASLDFERERESH